MPPMSQFLALPCEADSCTPERLSISKSVVDASFDLMLPAAAAITAPPGTSPPSAAPKPPVPFWLKLIVGCIV